MDENKTKEAFADICERVWNIAIENIGFSKEMAPKTREMVSHLVVIAWNAANASESIKDAKESVRIFNSRQLGGQMIIYDYLRKAVEIKWREYRDLKSKIAGSLIENVDGKPKAVAILEEEIQEEDTDSQDWKHSVSPDPDSATGTFHRYMESPEVQARLRNAPPEHLNEIMGKIVDEYNAGLPPVPGESHEQVSPKPKRASKKNKMAKEHFAKCCNVFWEAALEDMDFDADSEANMREMVMQLVASAWNAVVVTGNIVDAIKVVKEYNHDFYDDNEAFLEVMKEAVVYKDVHFPNDKKPIMDTAIEFVDGKPRAVAFFEGEK